LQDGDPEEGFIWFENIFDNLFQENVDHKDDKTDAETSTLPTSSSSDIFDSGDVTKSGSTVAASSLGDTDTTKLKTMESDPATATAGQPTMDLHAELSVFDAR
jgi:hypothetical protein